LVEEVARLWGFERLPLRPPVARALMMEAPEAQRSVSQLKRELVQRDFQEVINYSFVEDRLDLMLGGVDPVKVLNPIASQMNVMRSHLLGGLVRNLQTNLARKASRVRLFEIGKVFHRAPAQAADLLQVKGLAQPDKLGALVYGPFVEEQWGVAGRSVDFFDLKGDLEALGLDDASFTPIEHSALHPGRSAAIVRGGRQIGLLGELHPALVAQLELPAAPVVAEIDLASLLGRALPKVSVLSSFPPVQRDLAVVVSEAVQAGAVLQTLRQTVASEPQLQFVTNIRLFDEYRGKGLENKEKSLAFRFWMQDTQRTLDDVTVAKALERLTDALREVHGARLRT
jgi:phenylalanyl-tRNA synthetase beta chain